LGVLILARFTGWSRAELAAMDGEEMMEWINAIPKPKDARRE
jgi:hypothetical protein